MRTTVAGKAASCLLDHVNRVFRAGRICYLALELDAVGTMSNHGLSSFESSALRSIACRHNVRLKGRTPRLGASVSLRGIGKPNWRGAPTADSGT